jgi:Divergent InlB B-repeat domain/Domain of unknown function DUF11
MRSRAWQFIASLTLVGAVKAQPPVLTWHNDNARTGQNLQETILTTANVKSSTFGRLATINVDGKVDAQPLYVPALTIPGQGTHNVLYVATEHDSLYAFDADTFAQLLHVQLLNAGESPSDDRGCSQVTPEIGITATPAIDLSVGPHGTIYVISMSKNGSTYHQRLHALDLTTFAEQFSGPKDITASFAGTGAEPTFLPAQHKERPGLLIQNGIVYTSWGSHCDAGPYAGWVISYNETTLAQIKVLSLVPNGNDAGVWAAGAGPAGDAAGNVYLLTGNGTFDTTLLNGFPNKQDYGNAFVKMSGALSVTDYFTMTNTVSESSGDVDLGSAGLMLLPTLNNTQNQPVSLGVGAGKDGNIYVVDTGNLGHFSPSMDPIYQLLASALPSGTWSSPAWFNGRLYYGGVSDTLKAFTFTNGLFSLTAHSSNSFGYPGTTPSISANGTTNGIVWATENTNPAVLHAYDASNVGTELYNSNQAANSRDHFGAGNKYIAPMIANGKVYVGTTNGVGVFGLLTAPATPSLSITKTHTGNFTQAQQGATYTATVSNAAGGAATTGTVTVTETVPTGLTLVSMAGNGWGCGAGACTRTDALQPGQSYPAITVTVNVDPNAPASVTNSIKVAGGGDTTGPHMTTDPTTINPQMFTLTVNVAPVGGGGITPASGQSFANGTVVNLQATPAAGFNFVNWTGNVANASAASTTITMNSAQTVTANFAHQMFTLTINVSPVNGGGVTPASGQSFQSGTVVNLQATPAAGFNFANWTGSVANPSAASTTITMNSAQTVTANFTQQMFTLTTGVSPAGAGTVTPPSGSSFAGGSVVNLQATPNPGYSFVNWTGAVANPSSASTTITMNSGQSVVANFVAGPTTIGAMNTGKTGPSNARLWGFTFTNNGPGAANAAKLSSFTLTQVFGTACTPVLISPTLPLSLGNLAPGGSASATMTVDFSSCPMNARFTLQIGLTANAGASNTTITRANQFQ